MSELDKAELEVLKAINDMQKKLAKLQALTDEAGHYTDRLEVTSHFFDQWVQAFCRYVNR